MFCVVFLLARAHFSSFNADTETILVDLDLPLRQLFSGKSHVMTLEKLGVQNVGHFNNCFIAKVVTENCQGANRLISYTF